MVVAFCQTCKYSPQCYACSAENWFSPANTEIADDSLRVIFDLVRIAAHVNLSSHDDIIINSTSVISSNRAQGV